MAVELPEQELQVLLSCAKECSQRSGAVDEFQPPGFPSARSHRGQCWVSCPGASLDIPAESPALTPSCWAAAFSSQQWKWFFVLEPHTVGEFHTAQKGNIPAELVVSFISLFGPGCRMMTSDITLGLGRPS